MMAAGRAAECGAQVILLEKNLAPGKKLLITGGGRCNVTNAEPDIKKLLPHYKDAAKFLTSPFSVWNSTHTIDFFEGRGMPIKIEAEQRPSLRRTPLEVSTMRSRSILPDTASPSCPTLRSRRSHTQEALFRQQKSREAMPSADDHLSSQPAGFHGRIPDPTALASGYFVSSDTRWMRAAEHSLPSHSKTLGRGELRV